MRLCLHMLRMIIKYLDYKKTQKSAGFIAVAPNRTEKWRKYGKIHFWGHVWWEGRGRVGGVRITCNRGFSPKIFGQYVQHVGSVNECPTILGTFLLAEYNICIPCYFHFRELQRLWPFPFELEGLVFHFLIFVISKYV